jgi:hypothetical protein
MNDCSCICEREEALAEEPYIDVDKLEQELMKLPAATIEPVHYFADGIYAREITIPKGVMLTGKIHRTRHLNIISKGSIAVWTANCGMMRISAPYTFIAEPGTRRVGFAHEETVWTTIHSSRETDLEKLEAELIMPVEEFERLSQKKELS